MAKVPAQFLGAVHEGKLIFWQRICVNAQGKC
jgi:hypothetical protein